MICVPANEITFMKDLIRLAIILVVLFGFTFFLINLTGILTLEDIEAALTYVSQIHPVWVFLLVAGLLWVDLLLSIPTMAVSLLAGYFLGWALAVPAVCTGLMLAGGSGYWLGRRYGLRLLSRITPDPVRLEAMTAIFSRYGVITLIVCRALPMLPEISCCLAGATRLSLSRFLPAYLLGSVPYAIVVTYAGSISSLDNPWPALVMAGVLSLVLWGGGALLLWYRRHRLRNRPVYVGPEPKP